VSGRSVTKPPGYEALRHYAPLFLTKTRRMKILLTILLVLTVLFGWTQEIYHTGNEESVDTDHLPGLVLAGGETDNDDAMAWMLQRADGGDVVVLRASGSDGYNNYFYSGLGVEVNSVTSIVITGPEDTESPEVLDILAEAEVVFIAGGNQWHYVDEWRDSEMLDMLNELITNKKITIGGTSAGMAVLGEVVFGAENGTVWSSEALSDPYHWRVKLEKDFLQVPFMEQTVTDSHYNRIHDDGMDRHGRHVGFMARMIADWQMDARGIAANEYTAIAVDQAGQARVFGHPSYDDYAYFLQKHGGPPETCVPGEPLHWEQGGEAILVYQVKGDFEGSGWFDIDNWDEGEGGEWHYWYVVDGELLVAEVDDETGVLLPEKQPAKLKLYPNPADKMLHVRIKEISPDETGKHVHVDLLSAAGHLVISEKRSYIPGKTMAIDISNLPAGAYVVRLTSGNSSISKPWVKK